MASRNTPLRPLPFFDRPSEVRTVNRQLPLINHLNHCHPVLLNAVRNAVTDALRATGYAGVNDADSSEEESEVELLIPAEAADKVIYLAQKDLDGRGVRLEKAEDSVRIVAGEDEERKNPYRSTGY